ncbi:hypothetical protein B296_00047269 [Ensete ventricosum]|uniref:Uncharacterized protein n=1 Tax=Ensete ventricosum TaxID=4639 RepID=A0A426X5K1_ENSVE|nr:hypothetical protein B296_00047269 [Ensete ventricosum]
MACGRPIVDGRFLPQSAVDSRFLPQSAANGRNRPPTIDFWRYRPVTGMGSPWMGWLCLTCIMLEFDHMLWAMLGLDDDAKVLSGADYNTPVINQLICKFGTSIEAILVEIFPAIASRLIVVLPKDAFPSGPGCNTEV